MHAEEGTVAIPNLRDWALTDAVRSLSSKADHARTKKATVQRLKELARIDDLRVTVVVGFTNPLQEEKVREILSRVPDVALFSTYRDSGKLPLSWDYDGYCNSRGFDSCRPDIRTSLTSMFRKWVDLLTSEDSSDLRAFGLSLDELRASAKSGLWYGAIIQVGPKEGLALASIPEIDVLALGEMIVAFNDRP